LVCISRGSFVGGEALAERLAENLGSDCLGREQLFEAATREGIRAGKLEMAITRPSAFSERLALERAHYLAFVTAQVCDQAVSGSLVYHGRTAHLLFAGIGHILRVRVVTSEEHRIQNAMQRLGVDRNRARRFLEDVDDDYRKWARSMHSASWEDPRCHDVTVNLEHLSLSNAAAALTTMAELPDFRMTPASRKAMLDLRLAAHVRLALFRDERTHMADLKVRADDGTVTVSYLPHDASLAAAIPEVAAAVDGVESVRSTMATTNILWIQEEFEPTASPFRDVVEIATKWNAAVELVKLESGEPASSERQPISPEPDADAVAARDQPAYNGGIEDDGEPSHNSDLTSTLEELARHGRSGGGREVTGGGQALLDAIDRSVPYSLVVLGDVFRDRGHAAKMRMKRELQSFLGDHIKAPVVAAEELKQQYLFGLRDAIRALLLLGVIVVLYLLVFNNQKQVLNLLMGDWWQGSNLGHWVAALATFLIVPFIAITYGTFTKSLLKLLKIE
jgi:hypothetical protein